jgi:hypothetical protein
MSFYDAQDALYGVGEYGSARYGIVSPVASVSGVSATVAVQQPSLNIFEIDVSEIILGTGLGSTGSVGSLTVTGFANQLASSVSSTTAVGSLTIPVVEKPVGVGGTLSTGVLKPNVSEILDSVSATFAINDAGLDIRSINNVPITTSADATGSIGSVGGGVLEPLDSVQGTTTTNDVVVNISELLSGVESTASAGSITVNVVEVLVGVQATASADRPSPNVAEAVGNVSSTIVVGSVQVNVSEILESISVTLSNNSVVPSGVDNSISIDDRSNQRVVFVLPQKNRVAYVLPQKSRAVFVSPQTSRTTYVLSQVA